jgi:hypothetical protein
MSAQVSVGHPVSGLRQLRREVPESLTAVADAVRQHDQRPARAMREEEVLLDALPAYAAYRNSTAALLPGLRWQRRSRAAVASAGLASLPT